MFVFWTTILAFQWRSRSIQHSSCIKVWCLLCLIRSVNKIRYYVYGDMSYVDTGSDHLTNGIHLLHTHKLRFANHEK